MLLVDFHFAEIAPVPPPPPHQRLGIAPVTTIKASRATENWIPASIVVFGHCFHAPCNLKLLNVDFRLIWIAFSTFLSTHATVKRKKQDGSVAGNEKQE